jgi:hypothetical protein
MNDWGPAILIVVGVWWIVWAAAEAITSKLKDIDIRLRELQQTIGKAAIHAELSQGSLEDIARDVNPLRREELLRKQSEHM